MWKRSVLIPILILTAAAVLFFAIRVHWSIWLDGGHSQRTDDAYVRADQTPLSTRISGTVRSVYVGDYEPVKAGQLVMELDDSDYRAVVAESKAGLAAAMAEYAANQNAKRVADAGIGAASQQIKEAEAGITAAHAGLTGIQADVAQTEAEFQRQQNLLAARAATRQQFESAEDSRDRASAALEAHRADLSRATAVVASSHSALAAALQQRAALDAKDGVLLAQIEAKKASITVAEVNLGYAKIYAPSNGAVGEFRVHPGQLVGAGIQVVDLVQSGVWIQANYRETQLRHVQTGDPVDVEVDALPSTLLHGHVAQIAPASGSQFALLPPDNATGNYTKIVQRIPVRIALDQQSPLTQLRPGFSAVVTIHASGSQSQSPNLATSMSSR